MRTVLDFCNPEGNAAERGGIIAVQLHKGKGGALGIGENKLGRLIGVKLNDALCLVNDITGALLFGHNIGTHRQLAQVDFTVLIGGKLLGAVAAVHSLDLKDSIGNALSGICGIHLDQTHTRLQVIEEHQLPDAVSGLQLNLLRGGIHNVLVITLNFLHQIGAGLSIQQQNLTHLVSLELSQRNTVTPDFKGDIRHNL